MGNNIRNKMENKTKGSLILLFTSFVWGAAFVAQQVGMEHVGPFTFNTARYLIGGLTLTLYIAAVSRKQGQKGFWDMPEEEKKALLISGAACGLMLFIGGSCQQIALLYTSVGKAGFITSLYIVLVPVFGIFLKKKVSLSVWLGVILAIFGLYFLCINGSFIIEFGDVLLLLCAVFFAFHILIVDGFASKVDGVKLSVVQFFVSAALSAAVMFINEKPSLHGIYEAKTAIMYAGFISCGLGYTFQIIGQKYTPASIAALIMSLESVFSVLAGWFFLGAVLSQREIIGCVLMFAGIIIAEFPKKEEKDTSAGVNNL